jgi:DNA-damage-inducible protein J
MATAKAYLNIKLDKGIKETAAQLLESMGLDHTTAVDMYYRQIIKERRLPFQPESALSLDEQILASIKEKNIPEVALELDENGNAIVDKEKHPELYDWLVNG